MFWLTEIKLYVVSCFMIKTNKKREKLKDITKTLHKTERKQSK